MGNRHDPTPHSTRTSLLLLAVPYQKSSPLDNSQQVEVLLPPLVPPLPLQPDLLVLAPGILALPVELQGTLGILLGHRDAGALPGAEEAQQGLHAGHLGQEGQRQLGEGGRALVELLPEAIQQQVREGGSDCDVINR